LIAAGQRHVHHFGIGGGQQFTGFCQAQLGLFVAEASARFLAEQAAEMAGAAAAEPRELLRGVYKLKERLLLVLDTEKTVNVTAERRSQDL